MNEKPKSPIARMADMLAEMTERAVEAERQRDAAKEDANNWYRLCLDKDAQLKAAEEKLAALRDHIEEMKKGEAENG